MFRVLLAAFAITLVAAFNIASGQDKDKVQDAKDKDAKDKKQPKEKEILGKTIGKWIETLRTHEDSKQRWAALKVLDLSDAAATVGLAAVLDASAMDKDAKVRVEAINVMGRF